MGKEIMDSEGGLVTCRFVRNGRRGGWLQTNTQGSCGFQRLFLRKIILDDSGYVAKYGFRGRECRGRVRLFMTSGISHVSVVLSVAG